MADVAPRNIPKKVQDLFNKGFAALERGNFEYAIDIFFTCVELEPSFLPARKYLRVAEINNSKLKKQGRFKQMLSSAGDMTNLVKAQRLIKTGKADEALALVEKLLRNDPLRPEFLKTFAHAAATANTPEVAIQTLEIARDHIPEDITVLNWLGVLYQKMGRMSSARECFEKLCELCPNDPDAVKALKDAMALDSMDSGGWQSAAQDGSYRDLIRDTKEAQLLEQEAKAVKTERDVSALIAETLVKINKEPENVNYYRSLVGLYAQNKEFDNAIGAVEKALSINPGDPELDELMGSVRIRRYNHEIDELRNAGDSEGAAVREAERNQYAFDNLHERVRRYPNDLRLRYELGVMLYDNSYLNEAIQQFQLSQRSPKHRIMSLYYLALCFRDKDQNDLALEQLEKADIEHPIMDRTKKDLLYELGEVSAKMGLKEQAAGYYKKVYQVDIGYKDVAKKVEEAYGEGEL